LSGYLTARVDRARHLRSEWNWQSFSKLTAADDRARVVHRQGNVVQLGTAGGLRERQIRRVRDERGTRYGVAIADCHARVVDVEEFRVIADAIRKRRDDLRSCALAPTKRLRRPDGEISHVDATDDFAEIIDCRCHCLPISRDKRNRVDSVGLFAWKIREHECRAAVSRKASSEAQVVA